jgi:hypothetical protein
MEVYKLKGVDYYIGNVFSKKEAHYIAIINKRLISVDDLELTTIQLDRGQMGNVYRSYEEIEPYIEN